MICFLQCVSKAIGVSIDKLEQELNHCGRQVLNDLPPPFCYRGYSPMVVNMMLINYGYCLAFYPKVIVEHNRESVLLKTPVDLAPLLGRPYLKIVDCSDTHAVYRHNGKVYNPSPSYPAPDQKSRVAIYVLSLLN